MLESIVDPSASIAEGYEDAMPDNFGEVFTQPQLDGLVEYLLEATGGGALVAVEVHDTEHATAHAPPPRRGLRRLTGPGWLRVLWTMPLGWVLGTLLVIGARSAMGFDPLWEVPVLIVVWTVVVPLAFLAGLGGFDYWAYWISGRPTRPEDHSSHGARTWKDYFRVNTDHKVIGIQYLVTTIFFFVAAGLMAMFMRAELARPGMQYVDTNTFNGLFSVHASLMIFLFIIPAFAGLGNYVIPLMIGAPDMAFPRLNALSFWLLPIAGLIMLSSYLVPEGGAFAAGWTNYVPLAVQQADGNLMFQMGVQWAGASSIMTALNFLVTIITMRAPGMSFWRMPLLVWANFATSTLVVLATPFVAGSQFFIMFDRVLHTNFFNPDLGRRHRRLPAHLLVLLASGGLHHDAARLRHRLGGDLRLRTEADLRLPPDGALADGDPHPRLLGLGPPHVRLRACSPGSASR